MPNGDYVMASAETVEKVDFQMTAGAPDTVATENGTVFLLVEAVLAHVQLAAGLHAGLAQPERLGRGGGVLGVGIENPLGEHPRGMPAPS